MEGEREVRSNIIRITLWEVFRVVGTCVLPDTGATWVIFKNPDEDVLPR